MGRYRHELRTHFVESDELGHVMQKEDRSTALSRQGWDWNHARQQAANSARMLDAYCARQISGQGGVDSAVMAAAAGGAVKSFQVQIVEALGRAHSSSLEQGDGGTIERLDAAGGVQQDDGVRQGFQRRFKRVLGPHDFVDVRPPELGKIFGHLIERGRQLAELITRRYVDAIPEPAFADGVGATRQPPQRRHRARVRCQATATAIPSAARVISSTARRAAPASSLAPVTACRAIAKWSSRIVVIRLTARRRTGLAFW